MEEEEEEEESTPTETEPLAEPEQRRNPFLLLKRPVVPQLEYRWQHGFRRTEGSVYKKVYSSEFLNVVFERKFSHLGKKNSLKYRKLLTN